MEIVEIRINLFHLDIPGLSYPAGITKIEGSSIYSPIKSSQIEYQDQVLKINNIHTKVPIYKQSFYK